MSLSCCIGSFFIPFFRGFIFIAVLEIMMRLFSRDRLDPMQTIEQYPGTHAQRMEQALREMAAKK